MGRHSCCYKQKLRKGLWSPEEDEKLLRHITKYGHGCWSSVPKQAGNILFINKLSSTSPPSLVVCLTLEDYVNVQQPKRIVHGSVFGRPTKVWEELQIEVD